MTTEGDNLVEAAFGNTLRRLREAKKLSQEELADLCGIHRTYVSQLERGLKSPTLRLVWQMCDALDTEPAHLIAAVADNLKERLR